MTYADGSPTPEEMYYASQSSAPMSAAPPPPALNSQVAGYYGPPPPPPAPDAGPLYPYGSPADAPPAPPPPAPKPFSWNAPGFENATPTGGAVLGRAPTPPPAPAAGPPPVASDMAIPPALPPRTEGEGRTAGTTLGTAPPAPLRKAPPARTGGSGGGAGNSDPFGVRAARKGLYGTYDAEEAAMARGGENEMNRADAVAAGQSMLADRQQQEAERQAIEAAHAADIFRQHMNESERQLDDIRTQKVDPNRLYGDAGSKVLAVLGGVLGGLYQGLNKMDKNPFIEDMNRAIQQDIGLQERELSRQTNAVEHRQNALSQMRAIYKDESVAKLQAMNLMYEGAKQKLAAEAASYDSPSILAKTQQAIQQLDRQQKQLKLGDAMSQAAAAQAAAAAQHAREKEAMEFALKVEEAKTHRIAAEKTGRDKEAPLRERFVPTGQDEHGATGFLAATPGEAEKEREKRKVRDELREEINNALTIRSDAGGLDRALNRDATWLPSAGVPEWQTKIRQSQAAITAAKNRAAGLGALDAGSLSLLEKEVGNLESVGSSGDVALRGLLGQLDRADHADDKRSAGSRVRQRDDESIEPLGGMNAPNNPRAGSSVRREAP